MTSVSREILDRKANDNGGPKVYEGLQKGLAPTVCTFHVDLNLEWKREWENEQIYVQIYMKQMENSPKTQRDNQAEKMT